VNASGPWANQTAKLVSDEALRLVRPTRGTHIVVPEVLSNHAVLVMTPEDSRVIFVIPWRGYSLVGTTDLDDPENPDQVHPTEEEITYLLKEASRVFPKVSWERSRVISAFAGLRPLAWSDGGHASSVSREDKILVDGNLFNIVGGKLTTYHSMAGKALHLILKHLGKPLQAQKRTPLPGTPEKPWDLFLKEETSKWVSSYGVTMEQTNHLAHIYGQKSEAILKLAEMDPRLYERLHPSRPEILAQVAYAVQKEKAIHLEDILLRRLEIGYSKERWGEAPKKASALMAELLSWDDNTRQKEIEKYHQSLVPAP
jgi:glycerol-3-phosphate dehydrogenase